MIKKEYPLNLEPWSKIQGNKGIKEQVMNACLEMSVGTTPDDEVEFTFITGKSSVDQFVIDCQNDEQEEIEVRDEHPHANVRKFRIGNWVIRFHITGK